MSRVTREVLQKKITKAADELVNRLDPIDFSWLYSAEIESYLSSWRPLIDYYTLSEDTDIGVEAIRDYVHVLRYLRTLTYDIENRIADAATKAKHLQRVRDVSEGLEYYIDEIIKEVERTVNNPETSEGS